ncbi:MAG: hypothetical protein KAG97_07075 [Victivallales bacterium]|nr:hypothetical protein [Victivallales bacterium]
MLLFGQILAAIAAIALIPVALSALYYFTLACYSLLPRRIREVSGNGDSTRFAITLYARNAENQIAETIRRIIEGLDYDRSKFEVVVLADACDDSTAYVASFNGAKVLERRNEWKTGFAFALEWAVPTLMSDGFDAVLALDVDSVPLSNALKLLDSAISAGYRAARLPLVSTRQRPFTSEIAYAAVNRVNPAGRSNAGFSCCLSSPGFCLTRSLLSKIPFAADAADDILFYDAKLVVADEPIAFLSETALLMDDTVERTKHPSGASTAKLWGAVFAGNPSAFERLCCEMTPKAAITSTALLVEFLAGTVLMVAGNRFAGLESLWGYGRMIIIVSAAAAALSLFHLSVSLFARYSDSILRKAAARIRRHSASTTA